MAGVERRRSGLMVIGTVMLFASVAAGCRATIRSTLQGPPTQAQMAELWVEPDAARDLLWGVGGQRLAPNPKGNFTVVDMKRGGFSRGFTVKDDKGREWSTKFPPEASPEVVSSRILWGIGFHQPPVYYLAEWHANKANS